MIKLPVTFKLEQAIYGSFAFWDRGYAVLARSAGCRPEWLAELKSACQRCGEPPAGLESAESLFVLRVKRGPWMIVGVCPQGCDDQGRPGAMAFHALFVSPWVYRWIGADPFAFAGCLRHDWSATDRDRVLPPVAFSAGRAREANLAHEYTAELDTRTGQIVAVLAQRRRVIVQATEPIDELARRVWRELRMSTRQRATVATWAFDNANGFDLLGVPKLAGIELDASDLILALEPAGRSEWSLLR
jgi:hypothetical protein